MSVSQVISPEGAHVCDTLCNLRRIGGLRQVVGDGMWLNVKEATARLGGVSGQTVRNYVADDLLYAWHTAGGHRRIDPDSVDALSRALRLPEGPVRDRAMTKLRRSVRGRRGATSAPTPGNGEGPASS